MPSQQKGLTAVPSVLKRVYNPEDLLTLGYTPLGPRSVEVTFVFRPYGRTAEPMDHVSAVWITAAIIEGAYCVTQHMVESGDVPPVLSLEWLHRAAAGFVLLEQSVKYRRIVSPGEPTPLTFHVQGLGVRRLRQRMLEIKFAFDGFCRGSTTLVSSLPTGFVSAAPAVDLVTERCADA